MSVNWYRRVILAVIFAGVIWISESYAHEALVIHEKACRTSSICSGIDRPLLVLRFLGLLLAVSLPAAIAAYWRSVDRRHAPPVADASAAATPSHPMTASTR